MRLLGGGRCTSIGKLVRIAAGRALKDRKIPVERDHAPTILDMAMGPQGSYAYFSEVVTGSAVYCICRYLLQLGYGRVFRIWTVVGLLSWVRVAGLIERRLLRR